MGATERDFTDLTADIVAAYAANNALAAADLPVIISGVHRALVDAATGAVKEPEIEYTPVVSVKASIKPDYLVCLACGSKQKILKRHLKTAHGLTPEEYRARYGLPPTYPLVAPSYSTARSNLAKKMGLGQKRAA